MENILPITHLVLSGTPARWQSLVETIPADLLIRQPARNEWSAVECLSHLLDTEKLVFPVRLQAFLSGQNFPAFNPDAQEHKTSGVPNPKAMALEFKKLRVSNFQNSVPRP